MHMADALLSPQVGGAMIALSGTVLAVSARKMKKEADDRRVPLMGVLGAFVFAAQMINFSIPGTGSSGHLVGGILLMMLLGPYAAFITVTSVIVVQALLFADGGILAIGANVWNMGFYSCFGGWLIYKAITRRSPGRTAVSIAAVVGAVAALELGALSVVIETVLSGRSELPFGKFALLMAGIHLPIGLLEGVVTVVVVNFVYRVRPELVTHSLGLEQEGERGISYRPVIAAFALAALLVGGGLAWFASARPDGLEWAIQHVYGKPDLPGTTITDQLSRVQHKTALLPGYGFKPEKAKPAGRSREGGRATGPSQAEAKSAAGAWPNVSAGTSLSGLIGSLIVLMLVGMIGLVMVKLRGKGKSG